MTKDEALRLALEALEYHTEQTRLIPYTIAAIVKIKAALEAKDEPWESEMRNELVALGFDGQCPESIGITLKRWRDGYAAAQRKPLTDEEIWEALRGIDCTRPMLITRAIEAAHGIKGEA